MRHRLTKAEYAALDQEIQKRFVTEGPDLLAEQFKTKALLVSARARRLGIYLTDLHEIRELNKESINEFYFTDLNVESAYDLGFITADGCISVQGNFKTLNTAVQRNDKSIIEGIKSRLGSHHKLKDSTFMTKGTECYRSRVCISNSAIVESLMEDYGVQPRKTYIDGPCPNIDDELFQHYVRGYLDGDGGVWVSHKRGTMRYGLLGLPIFMDTMQDKICRLAGVPKTKFSKFKHSDTGIGVLQWSSRYWLKKLYDWTYPVGEYPYLARKKERLKEFVESLSPVNPSLPTTNTSGYMGVTYRACKKENPWVSKLTWNCLRYEFGYYPIALEAAYAYNHGSRILCKDRARLNILPENGLTEEIKEWIRAKVEWAIGRYEIK